MSRAITKHELARLLPNNRGTNGRHIVTVERMVRRGDLPPYDFKFADGVAGWSPQTVASDARLGSFVEQHAVDPQAA